MTINLSRAVPLVTGANRGLGLQLVKAFAEAGCPKIYAGCRSPGKFTEALEGVCPIALDVQDPFGIEAVARDCADTTILVNNAAVIENRRILGADDLEGAMREMDTNYWGTVRCCRAFAPKLRECGEGVIVNILSIGALANIPDSGSYCASKAAVASATQCIRAELKNTGVTVMSVFVGPMMTDMARPDAKGYHDPREVAAAILVAIEARQEIVFPDPTSLQIGALYGDGPWQLEKRYSGPR